MLKTNLYLEVDELIDWYMVNVNHNITKEFLNHIIDLGLIRNNGNKYSLDELNSIMLQCHNDNYITNNNKEYLIKDNRLPLLKGNIQKSIIENSKPKVNNKFIIEKLSNNKLKLKKIR